MKRLLLLIALAGCSSPTAPKTVFYACQTDTVTVQGNHYINCAKL